ncbi:MAG TPA: hypothetical protein VNW46_14740 [Gemmatimonadaceae bacterium]|jgi:hypothetical protein|nr:hypothetical protein [Gemmatimonadaceae bacterium]
MHLTDADLGAILGFADEEPTSDVALGHAETCANCRGAIRLAQAADRDVGDLLHLLDHATPSRDFAWVRSQARTADPRLTVVADSPPTPRVPAGSDTGPDTRPRLHSAIRWSAVVLSLSAAAAAALPSVRHFIARTAGLSQSTRAPAPAVRPPTQSQSAAPTAPVAPRGVAIVADRRVDIVFQNARPGTVLRVHAAVGDRVAVTASIDGSTYTVGRGTIVIDATAPGTAYDIDLPSPERLPEVSMRVADRVVFARHGATVHTRGVLQTDGSYTIR